MFAGTVVPAETVTEVVPTASSFLYTATVGPGGTKAGKETTLMKHVTVRWREDLRDTSSFFGIAMDSFLKQRVELSASALDGCERG